MRRILLLLALLLLPAHVFAQHIKPRVEPDQYILNLKGVLINNSGAPLPDGPVSVSFRLFKTSTPGPDTYVFREDQTVTVFTTPALVAGQTARKGKYSVTLGNQSNNALPASLFVNQTLYMEIWINNQAPPVGRLRQQILQIPADSVVGKSMNQVVWVTNALDHVENTNALETAALAFYINKIYATIPNADPNFVTRSLIKAEDTFSQRYRSAQTGAYRIPMNPLDAVVNMYGILIQQPGNPVTLPVISESLTFAAGSLNLMQGQYQQFSYELGRLSSAATFNNYTTTQLENLYLLARQNANVAIVVNTFFGFGFNAKVSDSLFTVLNKNTALRDSMNFAPLRSQIEADGTMLSTLDTVLANVADFYDRMTVATNTMTTALGQVTQMQKNDFVGAASNQNTANAVQAIFAAAQITAAPLLAAKDSSAYAVSQIALKDESAYDTALTTQATLQLTAAIAQGAADATKVTVDTSVFDEGDAANAALQLPVDGLNVAAAATNLALTRLPNSPTAIIQDGLKQISNQIQQVAAKLNERFDIIDANLTRFYNQMNVDFANLQQAIEQSLSVLSMRVDTLVNDVVNLQYSLDRLTQTFSAFATQGTRATNLVPYLTEINNWASDPAGMRNQALMDYGTVFSRCQTYATSTDLQPALENGNLAMDGFASQYDDAKILSQLDSDDQKNLNYILAFAYHRFYLREQSGDSIYAAPAASPATLHDMGLSLANPTAWEMSCIGMMRAATIYPDLGLSYIQTTNAFSASYAIGSNLQSAATSIALQQVTNGSGTVIQQSPILADMMKHQRLMASNLYNAIIAAEKGATDIPTQVTNVLTAYNDTSSPVSVATTALNGSRRLLEQYIEFGLSRSIKSDALLGPLLYAAGDPTFRDLQNALAADPNAQKLPDGNWVQSLYHNWVATQPNSPYTYVTGDPAAIFAAAEDERWTAMEHILDGNLWANNFPAAPQSAGHTTNNLLDILANNATRNNLLLGEQLANVDAVQSRLGYFLIPTVSGTVSGKPIANLPANEQPKSLANTAVTMTFSGVKSVFSAPVLLDSAGGFTVFVPKDLYTVLVKAPSFLQNIVQAPGAIPGVVDTSSGAVLSVTVQLSVGDITGDNQINNSDLIFLRDAMGSAFHSPGYDARYDLNGDGVVDYHDQILLQGALGSTTYDRTWNPICDLNNDGKIDATDQAIFGLALGVPRLNPDFDARADINRDGFVDVADFGELVNAYGSSISVPGSGYDPRADINSDGFVDIADFSLLVNAYGTSAINPNWNPKADFNGDGVVDYHDQEILQGKVGTTPADVNWNPLYDFNADGKIDTTDENLLAAALGTRASSANWNPLADLNGDGVVDQLDFNMLIANYGLKGRN